jgi:hypothetical protein
MQTWQFLYFLFNKYIKLKTERIEAFISIFETKRFESRRFET